MATIVVHLGLSQNQASQLRGRWDATVEVLIARHDLALGTVVIDADVEVQTWPASLVPDKALESLPRTPQRVAATIGSGEPVMAGRLAESNGGSAAVPRGRAAVEVDLPGSMPSIGPGDHIDLLTAPQRSDPYLSLSVPDTASTAMGDPNPSSPPTARQDHDQSAAVVAARDAIVLEIHTGDTSRASLTVAIRDGDVGATAAALLSGPVAVVVRPLPP